MDLVEGFTIDCQARGLTAHTIETYRSNVKTFLKKNPNVPNITLDDLRTFLNDLRSEGKQDSTLKGYFSAISTFFEYMIFEGILQSNPVLGFRKRYLARIKNQSGGENERQLITVTDMQHLYQAAEDVRKKAMISVLAKTGMRRGELLMLKVGDLDFRNDIIRIPRTAKRTNRTAFIDNELRDILEAYLQWCQGKTKTEWLWITDRGYRVCKDYINQVLADLGSQLGLHDPDGPLCNKLTSHCFRHFFTTELFRSGMDPQYIMWLRGDSMGKQAWQIYNHIDPDKVRAEYLRCIPRLLSTN